MALPNPANQPIPVTAPNLPTPPSQYSQVNQIQLTNTLRLFFTALVNLTNFSVKQGYTGTVVLSKLTTNGTPGSMVFVSGILTQVTKPT